MDTLECRGSLIACEKMGDGPPVCFAHCSSATHKEWLFVARELAGTRTCYLPDLMGYGESARQFDPLGREVACRDTDILRAIAERAGAPVDIVAHSYGAAASLEFALGHPHLVRSLFIVEPVSFQLLEKEEYADEYREINDLGRQICRYQAAGNSRLAARHYMSFWLGRMRWAMAPRAFRAAVVQTMEKVAFEFSLLSELRDNSEQFRSLDMNVTIVSGEKSPAPALAVVEILEQTLPNCRHKVIPGAGHMSPFTHRDQIRKLVTEHLHSLDFSFATQAGFEPSRIASIATRG